MMQLSAFYKAAQPDKKLRMGFLVTQLVSSRPQRGGNEGVKR